MASYQYSYVMKNLSKTFPGGKEILKGVTLSFLPDAKIGVLGVNGAGKSTILDALTLGLFGRPFRSVNKAQLINSINQGGTVVEIEFSIGSKKYIVKRGIKKNFFQIYLDGSLLNQDASVRDYQEFLEKTV